MKAYHVFLFSAILMGGGSDQSHGQTDFLSDPVLDAAPDEPTQDELGAVLEGPDGDARISGQLRLTYPAKDFGFPDGSDQSKTSRGQAVSNLSAAELQDIFNRLPANTVGIAKGALQVGEGIGNFYTGVTTNTTANAFVQNIDPNKLDQLLDQSGSIVANQFADPDTGLPHAVESGVIKGLKTVETYQELSGKKAGFLRTGWSIFTNTTSEVVKTAVKNTGSAIKNVVVQTGKGWIELMVRAGVQVGINAAKAGIRSALSQG